MGIIRDTDRKPTSRPRSQKWHRGKVGEPVHTAVVDLGEQLLTREGTFHQQNLARERIYEGRTLARYRGALSVMDRAGANVARLNALKSIIDTFTSRLAKDRPMPSFVVDDADWALKRKAKQYRKFIVGQMMETEFDDLSLVALLDGGILGNGFTRIDDCDDAVLAERMHVNEILFDRRECEYGKPQQAIRLKRVARDYLAELFPEHASAIEHAPPARRDNATSDHDGGSLGDLDDYLDTWEAWHLPTTHESANGRHALCIEGATLVSEEWHEPRFPWAMFTLFKPQHGLYGNGFVDQLAELQHRVNAIVRDIQLNLQATGRGHYLVNAANDTPVEMLSGFQPFKLKYNGPTPPVWNAPQPYNVAQMSALDRFIQAMYDLSGVSQASATSKSALGAGASGVALDTQYDIDSDRFRFPQKNYARYRLDGAQRYLDAAKRVARHREQEKGKKRSYVGVSWKNRDAIERLEYGKVALKDEEYRLQIEPVNFLPDTRAGKLSIVEQLLKSGVYPQWIAATLFDEPDLVQANTILLADFQCAMQKMDDLSDEDLPIPVPEPYDDLDLEMKITNAFYHRVKTDRAPDEIQDRFRQYMDLLTDAIATKKQGAAPPPMPAEPVGPDGMPMAPAELPMPGGVPLMPTGPVPQPMMIGAQAPPMVM